MLYGCSVFNAPLATCNPVANIPGQLSNKRYTLMAKFTDDKL